MSHCGTENCKRCQIEDIVAPPRASRLEFHSRETGMIDFLQLPGPSKVSFRVHSQFLAIPSAQIENIFPHALSGDFFHAWNIKLLTKT